MKIKELLEFLEFTDPELEFRISLGINGKKVDHSNDFCIANNDLIIDIDDVLKMEFSEEDIKGIMEYEERD